MSNDIAPAEVAKAPVEPVEAPASTPFNPFTAQPAGEVDYAAELKTQNERVNALEEALKAAELKALRASISARHGISDDDTSLFLTGDDEATLKKQAERLTKLAPKTSLRTPFDNPYPDKAKENKLADYALNLFNDNNN